MIIDLPILAILLAVSVACGMIIGIYVGAAWAAIGRKQNDDKKWQENMKTIYDREEA